MMSYAMLHTIILPIILLRSAMILPLLRFHAFDATPYAVMPYVITSRLLLRLIIFDYAMLRYVDAAFDIDRRVMFIDTMPMFARHAAVSLRFSFFAGADGHLPITRCCYATLTWRERSADVADERAGLNGLLPMMRSRAAYATTC